MVPRDYFAVESRAQKEAGVKYSLKDAYEEIINYTHHSSNALMVKAILEESAATIDWMAESGLETELVTNTQEVHQEHPRTYHQFIDKFNGFKRVMNNFFRKRRSPYDRNFSRKNCSRTG